MRIGPRASAFLVATAFAGATAASNKMPLPESIPTVEAHAVHPTRFLAFRSLTAQVDNQVVANLLTDKPLPQKDSPLMVVTGEISRCESQTCTVPLTLRVSSEGPVILAFAVANGKGELSDVQHAECGTGACVVSLVLERGRNTISI